MQAPVRRCQRPRDRHRLRVRFDDRIYDGPSQSSDAWLAHGSCDGSGDGFSYRIVYRLDTLTWRFPPVDDCRTRIKMTASRSSVSEPTAWSHRDRWLASMCCRVSSGKDHRFTVAGQCARCPSAARCRDRVSARPSPAPVECGRRWFATKQASIVRQSARAAGNPPSTS